MSSVYEINKGINKPLMFKGLKAQYIGYLGGGLLCLLILYAVLYISGLNNYVCLVLIGGLGTALLTAIFRMSHKYGQYGLLKKSANRSIPTYLKFRTRKSFINLKKGI
ncbi:DUF4133 domain-containing protein [Pedobacter jejuensis]|uniref:DUF4133 domain-containing protein n=1 Tax=Pedobacter jejuensis TaxID=1268550 RepID=A0A3N0BZZ9_9SPHI|nr:DUF4133 domain-containing protein [Pedobacter jejuensis]RNL55574.1 DUF4133 domain-containing protein [Pedobacter jejuensis]